MSLYRYKALAADGRAFTSNIDATSLVDAKQKLLKEKVAVFHIEELPVKELRVELSRKELLHLTKEIARLLHAGLPLFEALSALVEKYRRQKPHTLLLYLRDEVQSGVAFSKALGKYPKIFDLLYVSMIANAEKTGNLEGALEELSELLSKQEAVKAQLMAALLYPAMLSVFCTVVFATLLFYVIPSLKELFEGRDLHPFTQIVFAASDFACRFKIYLAALLLTPLCLLLPACKARIYTLPFLRGIFAKAAFVRFGRAAATLLDGGLPLIEAFQGAREVMAHPLLTRVVEIAEKRIAEGETVAAPFQHPLVPTLVPRLISIAEAGGKMPFMMRQIALIYEGELEESLRSFASLAQPILLLILGAIIGFVLLAVLLPLTDVSSFT